MSVHWGISLRGVYLDADMECLQRLDPLHRSENQCCFYAGMSNTGTVEVNNAVIGSCPHHPILKECIQRIHDSAKRRAETQAQHNQLAAIFAMSSQKSDNVSCVLLFVNLSFFVPHKQRIYTGGGMQYAFERSCFNTPCIRRWTSPRCSKTKFPCVRCDVATCLFRFVFFLAQGCSDLARV